MRKEIFTSVPAFQFVLPSKQCLCDNVNPIEVSKICHTVAFHLSSLAGLNVFQMPQPVCPSDWLLSCQPVASPLCVLWLCWADPGWCGGCSQVQAVWGPLTAPNTVAGELVCRWKIETDGSMISGSEGLKSAQQILWMDDGLFTIKAEESYKVQNAVKLKLLSGIFNFLWHKRAISGYLHDFTPTPNDIAQPFPMSYTSVCAVDVFKVCAQFCHQRDMLYSKWRA